MWRSWISRCSAGRERVEQNAEPVHSSDGGSGSTSEQSSAENWRSRQTHGATAVDTEETKRTDEDANGFAGRNNLLHDTNFCLDCLFLTAWHTGSKYSRYCWKVFGSQHILLSELSLSVLQQKLMKAHMKKAANKPDTKAGPMKATHLPTPSKKTTSQSETHQNKWVSSFVCCVVNAAVSVEWSVNARLVRCRLGEIWFDAFILAGTALLPCCKARSAAWVSLQNQQKWLHWGRLSSRLLSRPRRRCIFRMKLMWVHSIQTSLTCSCCRPRPKILSLCRPVWLSLCVVVLTQCNISRFLCWNFLTSLTGSWDHSRGFYVSDLVAEQRWLLARRHL